MQPKLTHQAVKWLLRWYGNEKYAKLTKFSVFTGRISSEPDFFQICKFFLKLERSSIYKIL